MIPDASKSVFNRSHWKRQRRRRHEPNRPSGIEDIAGGGPIPCGDEEEDEDDDEGVAAADRAIAAAVASAASTAAAVSVCICADTPGGGGGGGRADCSLLDLSGSNSSVDRVFSGCRACSGDARENADEVAAVATAVAAGPPAGCAPGAGGNSNADADSFTPRIRSDKKSVTVLLGRYYL